MNIYKRWFFIGSLFVLGVFVSAYALGDAFNSLVISFVMAYFFFPVIKTMENRGVKREISVILVFSILSLILLAGFVFIIPRLSQDITSLIKNLPKYIHNLSDLLIRVGNSYGLDMDKLVSEYFNKQAVTDYFKTHLSGISKNVIVPFAKIFGMGIKNSLIFVTSLINLLIIPLFFFYLILSYEKVEDYLASLLPDRQKSDISHFIKKVDAIFSGYFRGQLSLMLIVGAYFSVALMLAGVKYAFLIGLISGLMSLIPYVGFAVSVLLTLGSVLLNSQNLVFDLSIVGFIYVLEMALENFLFYPKLVGEKVGINTMETLLALSAGANLGGIMGVIISLPGYAIFKILLQQGYHCYRHSILFSSDN